MEENSVSMSTTLTWFVLFDKIYHYLEVYLLKRDETYRLVQHIYPEWKLFLCDDVIFILRILS